ncbi:MAG: universal stress protein [Nitrospirota bacterium]
MTPPQSLLVCTGGSLFAEHAIRMAGMLAAGLPARLTVLAVQDPTDRINVDEVLARARELLQGRLIQVEYRSRTGHAAKEIMAESEAGYDLSLIGSHGTKGLMEFFLGDTAVQVVEHLKRPTVIVRPFDELRRVLLCVQLGKDKPDVVAMAAAVARAAGAQLAILYVLPLPIMYGMHARDHVELMDRHPLETASLQEQARLIEHRWGIRPEIRLREGIPEEEILQETRESGQDLIVIGSSGRRGVSGLLLGAFSNIIVKHAPVSVLVVPPLPHGR